jgi:hypothetical protein
MRRTTLTALAALAALVLLAGACSDDDGASDDGAASTTATDGSSTTDSAGGKGDGEGGDVIVFNGQGNDLDAYEGAPPFNTQKLFTNANDDPENGLDINAQICFWDDDGTTRFITGEDTGQPNPPAGWGIFDLEGDAVGELEPTQVGKLTPTYQPGADPENYGCGVLDDGRLVTTDIGNQALGDATGQLIVWFPPFDSRDVTYCKVDISIATAQSIYIDDDDNIFVASSRGASAEEPAGVYKFTPPFPTGPDAAGGCDSTDSTGAPMTTDVRKELWIETSSETLLATPAGLAPTADGGLYVSSVFNGVINEYGPDGEFIRTILKPPAGETLGTETFSTGTPLGIGVAPDGTLYYADIGIVVEEGELPGPGDGTGSLRRIVFVDGEPQPPETMTTDLAYPDGIGVWSP